VIEEEAELGAEQTAQGGGDTGTLYSKKYLIDTTDGVRKTC